MVSASDRSAWLAAAAVPDPEVPCVTVADLGILRSVEVHKGIAVARVTPTYSGCPAVLVIEQAIEQALVKAGFIARIERVLSPAWTSDWITIEGRDKLHANGIAPPCEVAHNYTQASSITFFSTSDPSCPRCESTHTAMISEFGSTACKAHYRCCDCAEPFDYFKPL